MSSNGSKKALKQGLTKQRKEVKERFKEGVTKQAGMAPRHARKEAKKELKTTKKSFKLQRKDVKESKTLLRKKSGATVSPIKKTNLGRTTQATPESKALKLKQQALKQTKLDLKLKNKLHKHSVKKDTTLVRNQVKTESTLRVKQDIRHQVISVLQNDETLGDAGNTIQTASQANMNMRQSLRVTKQTAKIGGKVLKGTYGLGNRSFNLVRGKGFYRTPPDFTTRAQLMKKARQSKRRVKAYTDLKKGQLATNTSNIVARAKQLISHGVKLVVNNPITWLILVVILLMVAVVGAVSASMNTAIVQDEQDLTDSWVYMTKVDSEHNDESNTFFTNIDDVMFYMNHEFEDYAVKDSYKLTKTYENYLSDLWGDLNGKKPDYALSTMEELIKDKKSDYYMTEEAYSAYQEIRDEYGYLTLGGQLSFPFETEELTVSRRFGYEGKNKEATLFEGIEVTTMVGTEIVAPMDGTITKIPDNSSIEITLDEEYRLTLKGVKSSRFVGGETVKEGDYLGNATEATLMVHYFGYQSEQARWQAVNPAFYFPKVIYSQETILGIDYESMSLSPEVTKLIPKFKQAMKEEGMPEKFLAVVLAVCMQESGGRVVDVMQSSESLGLPPNTLGTDASIKQGVRYLWGNMKLIGLELINQDEKYIKTAVQAYNFGVGFIPYTKSNNYAYTPELAVAFANYMSGGSGGYGDSKYVPHVWRYVSGGQSSAGGNGQFAYPLPFRVADVSGFDYRINPVTGVPELHTGLDFPANLGVSIFASADAVVMRATDVGDSYGINVVLKHNSGGYWTRYAHMNGATVKEGDKVKKGQLIGYVGTTGRSTGPHLHYEVMTGLYSGHVDPRSFIN